MLLMMLHGSLLSGNHGKSWLSIIHRSKMSLKWILNPFSSSSFRISSMECPTRALFSSRHFTSDISQFSGMVNILSPVLSARIHCDPTLLIITSLSEASSSFTVQLFSMLLQISGLCPNPVLPVSPLPFPGQWFCLQFL